MRVVATLILSTALAACGQTGGEAIKYEAFAAPVGDSPTFSSALGWEISLTKAKILVGPVYIYEASDEGNVIVRLWDLLGPSKAYAHAVASGRSVLGDVIDQFVVDLASSTPSSLGIVPGIAGEMDSFEIGLHPYGYTALGSSLAEASELGGATFVLEGTATKDGATYPFSVRGDIGDTAQKRVVRNVRASLLLEQTERQTGRFVIDVEVERWFDRVDFSTAVETDDRGRYTLPATSVPGIALRWGIGSSSAYGAEWITDS